MSEWSGVKNVKAWRRLSGSTTAAVHLQWIVVNWGVVHKYGIAPKLDRIAVDQRLRLDQSCYTIVLTVICEQTQNPFWEECDHSKLKPYAMVLEITRACNLQSVNNISWRISNVLGVATSFPSPERSFVILACTTKTEFSKTFFHHWSWWLREQ